jgi:hypothetical protein
MIHSALARYDVREVLAAIDQEHPEKQIHRAALEVWFTRNLSTLYGINVQLDDGLDLPTIKQIDDFAQAAQSVLFRTVKPPVFDAETTPNFICEVTLRDDGMLLLDYSA